MSSSLREPSSSCRPSSSPLADMLSHVIRKLERNFTGRCRRSLDNMTPHRRWVRRLFGLRRHNSPQSGRSRNLDPKKVLSEPPTASAPAVTWLDVPFGDNRQVKALGGRWNPEIGRWYVPGDLDPARFAKWLPGRHRELASAELRTALSAPGPRLSVTLMGLRSGCWKCKRQTVSVVGFQPSGSNNVSAFTQLVSFAQEGSATLGWKIAIAALSEPIRQAATMGMVKSRFSNTVKYEYLSNGCHWCDALQGDFHLFVEELPEVLHDEGLSGLEPITTVDLPASLWARLQRASR